METVTKRAIVAGLRSANRFEHDVRSLGAPGSPLQTDIIEFLREAIAERRNEFASEIRTLQDHLDGLLADQARLIYANASHKDFVGEALRNNLARLTALQWQQREEHNAMKTLLEECQQRLQRRS